MYNVWPCCSAVGPFRTPTHLPMNKLISANSGYIGHVLEYLNSFQKVVGFTGFITRNEHTNIICLYNELAQQDVPYLLLHGSYFFPSRNRQRWIHKENALLFLEPPYVLVLICTFGKLPRMKWRKMRRRRDHLILQIGFDWIMKWRHDNVDLTEFGLLYFSQINKSLSVSDV